MRPPYASAGYNTITAAVSTRVAKALHPEREAAAPVLDHEPAAEHAAEVREVRHAGRRLRYAEQELERRKAEHEHACRHRNRRNEQHHPAVRKVDAVGEQQPVDAAGSPDHRHLGRAHQRGDYEMADRRADDGGEVILRVEARAEEPLDLAAEHVE